MLSQETQEASRLIWIKQYGRLREQLNPSNINENTFVFMPHGTQWVRTGLNKYSEIIFGVEMGQLLVKMYWGEKMKQILILFPVLCQRFDIYVIKSEHTFKQPSVEPL